MPRRLASRTGAYIALLAGVVGWFAFSTALLSQLPRSVPLAVGLLAALLLMEASGRPVRTRVRRIGAVTACLGGILAFWAAPLYAMTQRLTDSPSGSVSLFLVTVAPGLAVIVALAFRSGPQVFSRASSLALACAVGAAGLLANWERPSSFSPFVRFPERELRMALAAILFAAGIMLIERARARFGSEADGLSVAAGAVVAVLAALPAIRTAVGVMNFVWPTLLLAAVAYGVFVSMWLAVTSNAAPSKAAAMMLIAPVGLTGFSLLESITGVQGPNPIVWRGALAGATLCVVACTALLFHDADQDESARLSLKSPWTLFGLATGLLGLASLFVPAIVQTAQGITTSGESFSATWSVMGYQSAAGLAVAAASTCAVSAGMARAQGLSSRAVYGSAATALVACGAAYFLGRSTLSTWASFVPTEIQQAYGTEYARLTVEAAGNALRMASVVSTSVLALLASTLGTRPSTEVQEIS